jgi:hypothetical protein
MKSAATIAFDYRRSGVLLAAAGIVLLLGLAAVALSGLVYWQKAALIVVACGYAAYSLRASPGGTVRRCAWHDNGHWRLRDREGEDHAAVLLHSAVRGPLIALVFQAGALRRVSLVLLPDNCAAETRRQLRVRLARADALESRA